MVVTLLATPLAGVLELANIVMLFLLGVVGNAMRFGRAPAAFGALLNVAAFDYFFVPPRFSFAVSDAQYLVTFSVMLGVGLLVGQLTAGLRFSAGVSTSQARRAQSLFELTRELSGALESTQVVELGAAAVRGHFGRQARVQVADSGDRRPAGYAVITSAGFRRKRRRLGVPTRPARRPGHRDAGRPALALRAAESARARARRSRARTVAAPMAL